MRNSFPSPFLRIVLLGVALLIVAVIVRGRRDAALAAAAAAAVSARAAADSLDAAGSGAKPNPDSRTGPGWDEVRAAQANPQRNQGLVDTHNSDDSVFGAAAGAGMTTRQTYVAPLHPEPPRRQRPPSP